MGCIEDEKLAHLQILVYLHQETGIFREYLQNKTGVFREYF